MKGLIVQFFLVGFFGLGFTNSIENPALQKILQSTEKLAKTIQDINNAASNHLLSVETKGSQNEKENISQTLPSNIPVFAASTPENTEGKTNSTESNQSKHYNKDQEQLIHSDSEESALKGNQLFPSATGTSLKRSYSSNNNSIQSAAGTGYYDKTLDSNEHDYGYTDDEQSHHGIESGVEGSQHGHENHHYKKSIPLKPSLVHRDPDETYDHQDKIRTLDKDHLFSDEHKADDGYEPSQPYDYDGQKIPDCVQKNIYFYNLTFCLEDHHYPKDDVLWAIKQAEDHADQLLVDVTYQSADNLIDGLTEAEEEGHTHVKPKKIHYKRSGYANADSYQKDGYICSSDIYYGRPRRAMNTHGKWKVIVNLDHVTQHQHLHVHPTTHLDDHSEDPNHQYHHEILPAGTEHTGYHHLVHEHFQKVHRNKAYTQTLRLEQCTSADTPCSYIDSHCHSRCIQKHNFVRLVAWTYDLGLHVDTFKMPIACSCHVGQPVNYHQYHETEDALLPNKEVPHEYGHASETTLALTNKKGKNEKQRDNLSG